MTDATKPTPLQDMTPAQQRAAAFAALPKVETPYVADLNTVTPPPPQSPAAVVQPQPMRATDPGGGRQLVNPRG